MDSEGIRTEMEAAIIELALDLSQAALAEGRPAEAFWAARTGLGASPYEERLFQPAFRAAKAEGSTGKLRALMRELRTVLDVEIEPDDGIGAETLRCMRS